jgi:3-dehydroquinate synthase class II
MLRSTRRPPRIGLALAMLLAGCGASPPRVPTAAQIEAGPHVGVTVSPGLDAEPARAFGEHVGTTQLRNAMLDELARAGKADSLHGAALRVVVTRFRLRSTGSGVWLGAMAGGDMLDVSGTLERDGVTQREFQTGAGTIVAGLVKPTASGRFNGLLREVAKRTVAQL